MVKRLILLRFWRSGQGEWSTGLATSLYTQRDRNTGCSEFHAVPLRCNVSRFILNRLR